MDRRLDEMRQSLRASTPDWMDGRRRMDGRRATAVGLHETDDGYVLYADLPGFERDEIDLELVGDVLTLDADGRSVPIED
jgi:HSP20 family molecular chaperone IbpA